MKYIFVIIVASFARFRDKNLQWPNGSIRPWLVRAIAILVALSRIIAIFVIIVASFARLRGRIRDETGDRWGPRAGGFVRAISSHFLKQ